MALRFVLKMALACAALGIVPWACTTVPAGAAVSEITAPGTVDPGQSFSVSVSGDGTVEMWGPIGVPVEPQRLARVPVAAGLAQMTAPLESGSYELRFVGASGDVLSRFIVDVAASPVTLSIGGAIGAGLENPVRWRGPGGPGDMIQIYDPAAGAVVSEAPAIGQTGAENVTTIRAPERFGGYELRYWSGSRQATLRTLPIMVERGTGWLRTPVEVNAGDNFTIVWNGPTAPGHVYRIVDPASETVLSEQPASDGVKALEATFKAPGRAGRYRVRLVDTGTGFVISDLPLEVDPN
jgi:hypothetical protein